MTRRIAFRFGAAALVAGALIVSPAPLSPAHPSAAFASSSPWLDRFNAWRANAADPAVAEDTTYDAGDYAHAQYMVENDLVTHYETAGTPYYTAAGDIAAQNSNIFVSSTTSTTDVQAIDWWMGAPFHAMGMMDPRLATTGFGSYRLVKSGWQMGAALNVVQGNSFTGGHFPVLFPGDGTTEPLTSYSGNEFPDPLQACSGYAVPTGLPVFIELGGNVATTVTAHSFTGNGVALDHCVIDATNATLAPYLTSRGGAILIPRAPLQSGVRYTVSMTVNGTPYTWSFSVGALTSGIWTASYGTSSMPTSWVPGTSQSFPVTVTNTGNQTWPSTGANAVALDVHFTTVAGGVNDQGSWLTSQVFPLPSDVAPGASVSVPVSVTAPAGGGSMFLEAELFKNQEFWFAQAGAVNVTVAPATWSASYSMTPPSGWVAGQPQNVTVTVTNTGNQTWLHAGTGPVELDMHFATTNGGSTSCCWLTNQPFAIAADVAPGGSFTQTVAVTAPSTTGSLYLEAEMFKSGQFWFNQWQATPVSMSPAVWSAGYSMSPPASWVAGQAQSFNVTVTNTGNVTWLHSGANPVELDLHFATTSGGSTACCWLTNQVFALPADVAPGGSLTLTVSPSPSSTTGSQYLEAELFKSGQFWFGQWQAAPVSVAGAAWSASYSTSPPTSWTKGQAQSVSVTVTNTGNVTWLHSGANPVELDWHFATTGGGPTGSSWLTNQPFVLGSDVAPGASITITVNVTAPNQAGSFYLEAELFKSGQFWFNQWSATATTVS